MNPPRVLFVGEDPNSLAGVRESMLRLSGNRWDVLVAEGGGAALEMLRQQTVDLIVVDFEMPAMGGSQFLQLLQRKHPGIPRVVLAVGVTEAQRAACLGAGAEFCLEKPSTPEAQRQLYSTLNELVQPAGDEGFRGVLRRVGLTDVLQMECLAANSSILEVNASGVRGEICLRSGRIVHAWAGSLQGPDAFHFLLALRGGQFSLRPFVQPPEETIHESWEFLVMEAARRRDEASADPSGASPDALEPAAEAPLPDAPGHSPGLPQAPPHAPPDRPPDAASPRVEEVLLWSDRGEVLHDWQCPNPNGRIELMAALARKAADLGHSLNLGRLNRIEIHEPESRLVFRLHSDHGLLVRTSLPPPPEPA